MREILFRGKRIDNGEWAYGYYSKHQTGKIFIRCIGMSCLGSYEVDPRTVGQYTGLTDKNVKKIFEGDIVSRVSFIGMGYREEQGEVVYRAPEFLADCKHHRVMTFSQYNPENRNFEVIGNIHDNPELLEVKE